MDVNAQTVFLPAKVRGVVYLVFSIIMLVVNATSLGLMTFSSQGFHIPSVVSVSVLAANNVLGFVAVAIGYTALTNTPKEEVKVPLTNAATSEENVDDESTVQTVGQYLVEDDEVIEGGELVPDEVVSEETSETEEFESRGK